MKPSLLTTLYRLAEATQLSDRRIHTTIELARILDTSQQTVSRHLIGLERDGYIRRQKRTRGETIQLTEKGRSELRRMHATLGRIIRPERKEITLEGRVFSGLGEGAYYVSQLGYSGQFRKKLGFMPFLGTLNLRLDSRSMEARSALERCPSVFIESFSNQARTFGSVRCCKVILNGTVEAYLITAYRSHYGSDVVEIISPENLRDVLKLRDGDKVTVKVPLRSNSQ